MSNRRLTVASAVIVAVSLAACSVNPATGKSQLMLVSEGSEISMGLAGAKDVKASMPALENAAAQSMVKTIGLRMAKISERPQLPWDFTVLDDPQINAFALPGGPIFVTRGIMTHFNSEAELAAVLGHEIGHVTARHSAAQMSRQQLGTVGLLAGAIASSRIAEMAGALSQGMGLLFLKYGRDDETQADALGFRYAYKDGYDVREMQAVFEMLDRTSGGAAGKVPSWASTHPAPADRAERTKRRVDSLGADLSNARVNRDGYLRMLNGMTYGSDPRQGFFRGAMFHHPELAFRLEFPQGWQTQNGVSAVTAQAPQGAAVVQLSFAQGTPDEALRTFTGQQGMQASASNVRAPIGTTRAATFRLVQEQQSLEGLVAFVSYSGRTYQITGFTQAGNYRTFGTSFERVVQSLRQETDRSILAVQPAKVSIVTVPRAMSVEQFDSQNPSNGGLQRFLLVNNLREGAMLQRGQLVKQIVGGNLPN